MPCAGLLCNAAEKMPADKSDREILQREISKMCEVALWVQEVEDVGRTTV